MEQKKQHSASYKTAHKVYIWVLQQTPGRRLLSANVENVMSWIECENGALGFKELTVSNPALSDGWKRPK